MVLLKAAIFSHAENDWQWEGQGFSWASSIPGDDVPALHDVLEGAVLDGKQRFDSFFVEQFDTLLVFDVVGEFSSGGSDDVVVDIDLSFLEGRAVDFVLWFSLHVGLCVGIVVWLRRDIFRNGYYSNGQLY